MQPAQAGSPVPAGWATVLDQVQHTVAHALEQIASQEHALISESSPESLPQQEDHIRPYFERLEERLRGLRSGARQAEQFTREADAALAGAAEALAAWLRTEETAGRRLANWHPPQV